MLNWNKIFGRAKLKYNRNRNTEGDPTLILSLMYLKTLKLFDFLLMYSNWKYCSKEADIGFGELSITYERSKYAQFLNSYIITSATFVTSPPKVEPIITLFIKPFDLFVWIYLMSTFILFFIMKWLLNRYSSESTKIDINWAIICASLRQQFPFQSLSKDPFRFMFCSWLLACLVLTSSYSGCLHSLMAFPSLIKTIDTITELSIAQKRGEIEFMVTEDTNEYYSLKVNILFISHFKLYNECN